MSNPFASPINAQHIADFRALAQTKFGKNCSIQEVTLRYRAAFAVGDRAASADAAVEYKLLQKVAARADKNSITVRTQQPLLEGGNDIQGDTLIGVHAVAAVFNAAQVSAAADGADLLDIQQELDRSVLVINSGGKRRTELIGHEFMSMGSGSRVDVEGTNEANFGVKDRGWATIKPFSFGKNQTILISHYNNRITDWPQAFEVDFMFRALVAQLEG